MPSVKGGIGVYRPITEITKDIKALAEELEAAVKAQEQEETSEENSSDE